MVITTEGVYWHPVSGDQGCCSTTPPPHAQDGPPQRMTQSQLCTVPRGTDPEITQSPGSFSAQPWHQDCAEAGSQMMTPRDKEAKAPTEGPTPGTWLADLCPITELESGVTQSAPRSTECLALRTMQQSKHRSVALRTWLRGGTRSLAVCFCSVICKVGTPTLQG